MAGELYDQGEAMKRLALLLFVACAVAEPVLAIPAFARRYKVECHFCHDGYPKLNVIGQRFKERGFRMEREDAFDASKWLASVPLTLRAQGNYTIVEEGKDSKYAFLKGISAGNLGSRLTYWVDDSYFFQKNNNSHIKPENAWGRLEIVTGGKLYAKVGRIEMDLPFTQARTPHLFPYEIYGANTGFETDSIGVYQEGIELGGDLPKDVHWSAAVVKGRNFGSAKQDDDDANLFLRLAKRIERHRIGTFAYLARNTLVSSGQSFQDQLLRVGVDANVWIARLNLYGLYMYGRNDNSLGDKRSLSYSGGFAQADYHVRDSVVLTLRLNAVSAPPGGRAGARATLTSLFPGVEVFIFEHGKLSFEYGFLNKGRTGGGAVQLEAAF
jgi:hypothetical protein